MTNTDTYVVWSFEHDAWWRPGGWGYTTELAQAGHYTREAADKIVADANIVEVNEEAIRLDQALKSGPPMKPKETTSD